MHVMLWLAEGTWEGCIDTAAPLIPEDARVSLLYVVPEDVLDLVQPVLGHRLSLVRQTSDALEERNAIAAVLRKITASIPAPV